MRSETEIRKLREDYKKVDKNNVYVQMAIGVLDWVLGEEKQNKKRL